MSCRLQSLQAHQALLAGCFCCGGAVYGKGDNRIAFCCGNRLCCAVPLTSAPSASNTAQRHKRPAVFDVWYLVKRYFYAV